MGITIAVYRSAIAKLNKSEFKKTLLTDWAYGAKASGLGDDIYLVDDDEVIDADLAVLQGWVGMKTGSHLKLRERVIKHQRKTGKHTMVIDSNLYGFLDPRNFNRYLRYSLDGVFPTTGFYFDNQIDRTRWASIKSHYGFAERGWSTDGKYILLCLQRNQGWSLAGGSVFDWLKATIPKIRQYSDRPLLIRGHPGNAKVMPDIQRQWGHVAEISTEPDIRSDFNRACATITYNSSPGVASTIWGVPAWVTDPEPQHSQAWPCVNTDLSLLEHPVLPDRGEWYHRIAQCHFSLDEMRSGYAWSFMRPRIKLFNPD